jgi:hypothetical protein
MSRVGKTEEISQTVRSLRKIFKAIEDYPYEGSSSFGITGPQLWALKTISQSERLTLGSSEQENVFAPEHSIARDRQA